MGMNVVAKIRQATRRKYTAQEKIRIVLEGLRGEIPISELCRREGIAPTMYYRWSKAFLDAGKNGLTRDTQRDATTDEVVADRCDVPAGEELGLVLPDLGAGRLQPQDPGVEAPERAGRGRVQRGRGAGVRSHWDAGGSRRGPCEASVGQRCGADLEALRRLPGGQGDRPCLRLAVPPADQRQDRAVSPLVQGAGEPVHVGNAGRAGGGDRPVHCLLQPTAVPRGAWQCDAG